MTAQISVSVATAAHMTGLSQGTIRDAVNSLDLPARRVGRRIIIRVTDLDAWITQQERVA